jgi:hypothetical protein
MGSVTAYVTNAGKRYRVIYRKPDHIQTQKRGFKTKRDAELFLAKVQTDSEPKDYEARSIPVPSTILAELKTHVEGKEAGLPVFAAARGGWLRGRVFRRGWLDEAAEMIGHASAAVTLDVYSDLFDSDLDAVSAVLDAAMAVLVVAITLPRA